MVINKNKMVKIHYELKDDNGMILDSSVDQEPLEYIHGTGFIIEGLEEALEGKKVGDKFTISVTPEKGYGQIHEELKQSVLKKEFGDEIEKLAVGQQVRINGEEGNFIVTISEITPDSVILDANHPLAGKNLNFSIEVLEIREATPEEVENFLNADCDCDCHDEECGCEKDGECSCHSH